MIDNQWSFRIWLSFVGGCAHVRPNIQFFIFFIFPFSSLNIKIRIPSECYIHVIAFLGLLNQTHASTLVV